ncbi:MAG: ring-opening amidohydrolase [Thermostichus sp. HHBFW_bins_43]
MIESKLFRIPMLGPDDVSGLKALVDQGVINPEEVIAILGKTEGNGCVNDFSRGFSTLAFRSYLQEITGKSHSELSKQVAFVMSGGTEGVMSPHAVVFTNRVKNNTLQDEKSFVAVSGFTREFLPEEIGTKSMVSEVAKSVIKLMDSAGIDDPEDVHFVQVKCPLLTSERINDAHTRGKQVVTHDTYKSMAYSRAASALGVGVATKELKEADITEQDIGHNWSLYSSVASTSAGIELMNCELILMGNSRLGSGEYWIGHGVMQDSIDLQAVLRTLKNAGLNFEELPNRRELNRIVSVFAKAEISSTGIVRNRRTTALTDSDINHTRHARAVVNAVIASVVGDPMIYVSGGAEHQGPDGGGPIAVIVSQ